MQKGVKLRETKAFFCPACGERVNAVFDRTLNDISIAKEAEKAADAAVSAERTTASTVSSAAYMTAASSGTNTASNGANVISSTDMAEWEPRFQREICQLGLSVRAKNFALLEYALMIESCSSAEAVVKSFSASFEDSYKMIQSAIKDVTKCDLKANIISAAGVKTATFVFNAPSNSFLNDDSVLAVNLVHADGKAIVTTKGCNYIYGDYRNSHKKFWTALQKANPELEICPIRTLQYNPGAEGSDIGMESDTAGEGGFSENTGSGRIGVLGGSFDPVHLGHVALGRAAMAEGNLQKLIVMPTHVQPFKRGREVAEDHHRIEMCRLAFADTEKAEISEYEMTQTEISYTYDTLAWLSSVYPDSKLYFITGTDAFLDIEYWRKGRELLEHYSFMVSVRPGYKEKELEDKIRYYTERYKTEVILLHGEMPDISSTKIKARRSQNLSISGLVPESVERYIHEHKLYF